MQIILSENLKNGKKEQKGFIKVFTVTSNRKLWKASREKNQSTLLSFKSNMWTFYVSNIVIELLSFHH